jgi:hypothetical protein
MPVKPEEVAKIIAAVSSLKGKNGIDAASSQEIISYIRSEVADRLTEGESARFGCAYFEALGARKIPDPGQNRWVFIQGNRPIGIVSRPVPVKKT